MDQSKTRKVITTKSNKKPTTKAKTSCQISKPDQNLSPVVNAVYNNNPQPEKVIIRCDTTLDQDILKLELKASQDPTNLKLLKMLLQFKTFRELWQNTKDFLND
jgi:hypothetical protein